MASLLKALGKIVGDFFRSDSFDRFCAVIIAFSTVHLFILLFEKFYKRRKFHVIDSEFKELSFVLEKLNFIYNYFMRRGLWADVRPQALFSARSNVLAYFNSAGNASPSDLKKKWESFDSTFFQVRRATKNEIVLRTKYTIYQDKMDGDSVSGLYSNESESSRKMKHVADRLFTSIERKIKSRREEALPDELKFVMKDKLIGKILISLFVCLLAVAFAGYLSIHHEDASLKQMENHVEEGDLSKFFELLSYLLPCAAGVTVGLNLFFGEDGARKYYLISVILLFLGVLSFICGQPHAIFMSATLAMSFMFSVFYVLLCQAIDEDRKWKIFVDLALIDALFAIIAASCMYLKYFNTLIGME